MKNSEWIIEYEGKRGTRIMNRFNGVTAYSSEGRGLWWSFSKKEWTDKLDTTGYSSHAGCRTFRAFLRHIRTKGSNNVAEFVLCNRYVGLSISAIRK